MLYKEVKEKERHGLSLEGVCFKVVSGQRNQDLGCTEEIYIHMECLCTLVHTPCMYMYIVYML